MARWRVVDDSMQILLRRQVDWRASLPEEVPISGLQVARAAPRRILRLAAAPDVLCAIRILRRTLYICQEKQNRGT